MEVDTRETLPQRLTSAATKPQAPESVQTSGNSRERSQPPGDVSDATCISPRSDVERVDLSDCTASYRPISFVFPLLLPAYRTLLPGYLAM
jgi:hypothetical protein